MIRSSFLALAGSTLGVQQVAQLQPYTATMRVAALCPQSGPDRNPGLQLLDGIRAAEDEANRLRTSFEPVLIVTPYDDHNTPADAVVQGQFAANAPDCIAAIGHLSASATLAALPRYGSAQMPLIVPTVTDDRVTAQGYRNVFRLPAKDSDEGRLVAGYVVQTGSKAPHVVTQDADYGPAVAAGFIQRAGALHVNAGGTRFPLDSPDFADAAAQVLKSNPDCVVLAGNVGDMGALLAALHAKGYTGRLVATQGFFDAQTVGKYAKDAQGLVVSSDVPYYPLAPTAQRAVQDYQSRYGGLSPIAAFGYASVQLIRAAVRRTNATTRVGIIRALASGGAFDTITGSYTFGPSGDQLEPNCYFYKIQDGKFTYERQAHSSGFMLK